MPSSPRYFALVPCAGLGERAGTGGPKQYAQVAGRSLVAHTLAALAGVSRLAQTLVVLSEGDAQFEVSVPGFDGWIERVGGATRARSVENGLGALKRRGAVDGDWVLVHDAARCLVLPAWIDALIDACADDEVGGLLAWPVADTLKREAASASASAQSASGPPAKVPRVLCTIDRHGVWQAQTPQMFRIGLLQEALARSGAGVTDEASAIEALGHAPRLVHGAFENFKLTYPGDFALAERLLASRKTPSLHGRPA